ncbi:nucleoporin Nup43 [Leptopilina boulardi]|uniref:nucleoporin Nup43 n=1 Tax=Leptopilina boulardi TaxID=63433 RepID=UPI0021F576E2|nr:nucleoporin Nup43 [Leptopilina boulardi]
MTNEPSEQHIVQGKFVSEKISKIRWQNEPFAETKTFLTGSWDNPINKITLWTLQTNEDEESDPVVVTSDPCYGDVTEIKFINKDFFVVSSSDGTVKVLQILENPYSKFKEHITWKNLHYYSTGENACCTGFSTFEQDIVSVGEDGRINLLTAHQKEIVRSIDTAESCSICCIDFLKHNEILTGNIRGHMKIWDLRNYQDRPVPFMLSDQVTTEVTSVAHHPTQRHIVVAGGGDGSLTVWDLRRNTYPVSQLNAHAKSVTEILFHPDRPDNLFTSSTSGELWHWNNASQSKSKFDNGDAHWLNSFGGKGKVTVCASVHKPINSIDINKSTLLLGCDNEAIYTIKNVNL